MFWVSLAEPGAQGEHHARSVYFVFGISIFYTHYIEYYSSFDRVCAANVLYRNCVCGMGEGGVAGLGACCFQMDI